MTFIKNQNTLTLYLNSLNKIYMHLTGTKQEWGKIFGFLQLLLEKGCEMGDHRLQIRENRRLSLLSLSRKIEGGSLSINPDGYDSWIFKIDTEFEKKETRYDIETLNVHKTNILDRIKKNESSFHIEEVQAFLENIGIYDFVSYSEKGEDFTATFVDQQTGYKKDVDIRLRTLLDRHYLLSTNRASNFKFDITQTKFSNPETNKINAIGDDESGSLSRLSEIFRLGGRLKYTGVEGKFFHNSLQLIDMHLARLLGEMVKLFYTGESITLRDLTKEINEINLFKVKDEVISKGRIYEYKIRQFLYACACGLKSTKTWRGYSNTDIQIFITKDAQLRAYDPCEKEIFERFLWENTRLSLGNETKSKYGAIEKENGQWLIKLNLEICFQ